MVRRWGACVLLLVWVTACGRAPSSGGIDWARTRHGPRPAKLSTYDQVFLGDFNHDGSVDGDDLERPRDGNALDTIYVLNNCDSDRGRAPDHENRIIDGPQDADDLALLYARLPRGEHGRRYLLRLVPSARAADFNVFIEGQRILGANAPQYAFRTPAGIALLERGVRLFIEGRRFGARARLQLVEQTEAPDPFSASVRLVTAPWLTTASTAPAERLYVSSTGGGEADCFVDVIRSACGAEQGSAPVLEVVVPPQGDRYMQDQIQWGHTTTPWRSFPMPVVIDLPRDRGLKEWSDDLCSPDVGYLKIDEDAVAGETFSTGCCPAGIEDLPFGGNVEVTPPVPGFPHGRILAGLRLPDDCDPVPGTIAALREFLQGVKPQPPVLIDTSWLQIGHVDEVFAFLPASDAAAETNTKALLLVASPRAGLKALSRLTDPTLGEPYCKSLASHFGPWTCEDPGTWTELMDVPVPGVQAASLRHYNRCLDVRIFGSASEERRGGLLGDLLDDLGDGADALQVIEVPVLFHQRFESPEWCAQALVPNMVNLLTLEERLLVPKPHLESFSRAFETALQGWSSQTIDWVDTWDYLHLSNAGVHCATNVRRVPPAAPAWWEGEGGE